VTQGKDDLFTLPRPPRMQSQLGAGHRDRGGRCFWGVEWRRQRRCRPWRVAHVAGLADVRGSTTNSRSFTGMGMGGSKLRAPVD